MDAIVLDEWGGELATEEVPTPEPGPSDVAVEVRACGVTRTVENAIQGGLSDDPELTPRIPGHEFAGKVVAVGEAVEDVAVGDRVVAYFYLTCDRCDACRAGRTNQCTDFGGWYGVQRDGAYAEVATLPAANALPLPREASYVEGAIAADGLATPLHVCERTDLGDDDVLLVIGAAGRIGIHLCQLAVHRGATVLAADIDPDRLKQAIEATDGRAIPVDALADDLDEVIRKATPRGGGPTVAVDTVGDVPTIRAAWDALGMGGQLVSLTTHHERAFAPLLKDFVVNESAVLGSRYATKDEVVRAARLFADGLVDPIVTETVGIDEIPGVHQRIRSGESHGFVAMTT
ncbi:MAG: alcohol dehydrogenase catalytic domain-containing protein [Halobacteriota archaeon]